MRKGDVYYSPVFNEIGVVEVTWASGANGRIDIGWVLGDSGVRLIGARYWIRCGEVVKVGRL